ncbi:class V lanthionine synthetase subunit LxmK [Micromonospora sp. DT228]|uniref:class V lanthionine synthetase subunit LxmK n=1 Tax=Micromonospora sp. DT228 TaxID=3393443 RepID=UPI003CF1AF8F
METSVVRVSDSKGMVEPVPPDRVPALAQVMTGLTLGIFDNADVAGYLGRNDNWAGRTDAGRDVFVKRLNGAGAEARFDRTTAFERFVGERSFDGWSVPTYLGGDRASRIVAFERITDGVSAAELLADDTLDTVFAERAGRALGELHARPAPVQDGQRGEPRGGVGNRMRALELADYADCSGADLEAWSLLQHDRQLARALDRLAGQSAVAARVPSHCDLRLDQFLLVGTEMYIVDWEEFRLADAAIDLGSFAGELLHRAAAQMFAGLGGDADAEPVIDAGEVHAQLVRRGAEELDKVRVLISAFWAGYRERRADAADASLAERATAYAGWHLFDRLLAASMFSASLTAAQRGMVGIGRNALVNPDKFVGSVGLSQE